MAKQTGVVTYATLVAFRADTIMVQQVGDVVQILDVLKQGVTHIARTASTEVPDNIYTIRKTNDATKTFWASSINDLLRGSLSVAFPAVPDNSEHEITLAVTGALVGQSYDFGVISGLPLGTELILRPVTTANSVTFIIKNNTGATLTAGTILVNIYN